MEEALDHLRGEEAMRTFPMVMGKEPKEGCG